MNGRFESTMALIQYNYSFIKSVHKESSHKRKKTTTTNTDIKVPTTLLHHHHRYVVIKTCDKPHMLQYL